MAFEAVLDLPRSPILGCSMIGVGTRLWMVRQPQTLLTALAHSLPARALGLLTFLVGILLSVVPWPGIGALVSVVVEALYYQGTALGVRIYTSGPGSPIVSLVLATAPLVGLTLAMPALAYQVLARAAPTRARCSRLGIALAALGVWLAFARSRRGFWVIKRKTAKDRLSRAITRIGHWCRDFRHLPLGEQHRQLSLKLRGHYEYYGITGNAWMLARLLRAVQWRWHFWLNRRSQRRDWTWERFMRFMRARPLPPAIPVHSTWRYAANP